MSGLAFFTQPRTLPRVSAGAGPRRESSARSDLAPRPGRPLVAGRSNDHAFTVTAPPGVQVGGVMATPARPFEMYTLPRRRMGTVPKLAPGRQGSGLGQPVMAGFQTPAYTSFTPMTYGPATQPNNRIEIPAQNVVAWLTGRAVAPTYNAHDFTPATRFFNQARSSGMWAQGTYSPVARPLTPSQQGVMVRRPSRLARRQIPAAQPNPGLYAFGYPTAVGVAARLGGGPVAVLGGNSQ